MSSAVLPPVAPPAPPFKNRRGWIIAFGVFEILIGCLVLLLMGVAAFGMRMATARTQQPALETRFIVITVIFYGAIAALFVVVGIGNTQVRRWARMVMLGISWAWLALGVLITAMMAFVMPMIMKSAQEKATQPMPEGFNTIFGVIMFAFLALFFIVLPLIFVAFYSGRNVKATYEYGGGATEAGPLTQKPMSVLFATAWFGLSVLGYLYVFASPVLPLFGHVFRGWQAILVAMALEAVVVWLVINIYRQTLTAWRVAIAMITFSWTSFLVTMTRMNMSDMYRAMGYNEVRASQVAPIANYMLAFSGVLTAAFLVMLIVTRKHYRDAAAVN